MREVDTKQYREVDIIIMSMSTWPVKWSQANCGVLQIISTSFQPSEAEIVVGRMTFYNVIRDIFQFSVLSIDL